MAPIKRLASLHALYYCPDVPVAEARASELALAGMSGVQAVTRLASLEDRLIAERPHMLMLDMDDDPDDVLQMVRRLRRGRLGPDPFLATLACCKGVTSDLARKFASAGFDRILNKPYTPDVVILHMKEIAEARRRFVATKGYVGPDRRRGLRDLNQPGVIDVPNRIAATLAGASFDWDGYLARAANWRTQLDQLGAV